MFNAAAEKHQSYSGDTNWSTRASLYVTVHVMFEHYTPRNDAAPTRDW